MTYTTRLLTPLDAKCLDDFLLAHTAEAYYLRSNALAGGLAYEGKYLQGEYFGAFRGEVLVGVICYSWMKTILVYADEAECLPQLTCAVIPSIKKRNGVVEALLGLAELANIVIRTLKMPVSAFRRNDLDGLYRLQIKDMRAPVLPSGFNVRLVEEKDREQIIAWRIAFNIEAVRATPGEELHKKVREEIGQRWQQKDMYVLENGKELLSFCGAGGHIPDTVMVGPVWTPVDLRCRGYGRAVTANALNLASKARDELKQAVLFATRPDAIKAYEAIGFTRMADWCLALTKDDYRVDCGQ